MAHITFLDQTLRDGPQSLWGLRMRAGMALPAARLLDETGFNVIDLTGSTAFECLIRYCRENPWEGLDLIVKAAPKTPIRAGMRSNAAGARSIRSSPKSACPIPPARSSGWRSRGGLI